MLGRLLKAAFGALTSVRGVLGGGRDSNEYLQQALTAQQTGDTQAVEAVLRAGIVAHPSVSALHVLLAEMLLHSGRDFEARMAYERALALEPQAPEISFNYASVLARSGDLDDAQRVYRAVIEQMPDWAAPHLECGFVLYQQGEHNPALVLFERALALAPESARAHAGAGMARAHAGAGMALISLDRPHEAIRHFYLALDIEPNNGIAFENLCAAQYRLGDDAALRSTLNAHRRAARCADGASIMRSLTLPSLIDSRQEITEVRARLRAEIEDLSQRRLTVVDPTIEVGVTNFNLAYQGENDLDLHKRIAALHLRACPALNYVAPHCSGRRVRADGRIRLGIASTFLHDHSIGRVVRGLFARLDRARVSVHGFAFRSDEDAVYRAMRNDADEWVTLPRDFFTAREMLARAELDVLLYPDIGMDPLTYFLAFARLAPVQCTTWGHPVTSGVPTLDYYISTDYFEPSDGAQHYSERLVRLNDVAFPGYYLRQPAIEAAPPPGFDRGRRVYFCPQVLFKLHPDFDDILADILRRDPGGEIVMTHNGAYDTHRLRRLQARLKRSAGDVYDRFIFLRRTHTADGYLQRLRAADVVLDTVHYCGGNTSLEAISAGALLVTLPSALQRGRHTYGFFRKMRFTETVVNSAEEYAQLAVRIATDKALSTHLKSLQEMRSVALYEDLSAVRQMADFFERAFADVAAA